MFIPINFNDIFNIFGFSFNSKVTLLYIYTYNWSYKVNRFICEYIYLYISFFLNIYTFIKKKISLKVLNNVFLFYFINLEEKIFL